MQQHGLNTAGQTHLKKIYRLGAMEDPIEITLAIFRDLTDPRVERTKIHRLETIMFIALCSYLSGGDGFYDMEDYAHARQDWLSSHIGMQSIPSHDTFNRVFQAISPSCFGECLLELSRRLREKVTGDIVAFDGKTHRRTTKKNGTALHMLNAWSVENRLVLGQLAVEEKSNEITAIPQLMDMLDLKGCVVTADALNCQKVVAAKAIEKQAAYLLALKSNHPMFYEEVRMHMDALSCDVPPGFEQIEKEYGRIETRRCWQSPSIDWYSDKEQWAGLQSFVLIESVRESRGKIETNRRYYISSLAQGEVLAAKSVRAHWQIENALHWCLDVVFDEDQSRARVRNAGKNLGILRSICLNLLRRMPGKSSLKGKRFKIALSEDFLLQALRI
ncbi:ISAs1 family transposase [Desulfovibrio sp. 3_1_syn3]|uniref:ISAs1 family transposase n=1 Tax=Desulfovibrio sp. 3_1_syn3 TaxID=457398 RepID=UPI001E3E6AE0|nr:ISAs1 family transposase [Desulfovibrio sp. 3_1_syn3]